MYDEHSISQTITAKLQTAWNLDLHHAPIRYFQATLGHITAFDILVNNIETRLAALALSSRVQIILIVDIKYIFSTFQHSIKNIFQYMQANSKLTKILNAVSKLVTMPSS